MKDNNSQQENGGQDAHFAPLLDERQEQRQEYRLTGRLRVEVETAAADPANDLPAQKMACFSSDISASGLRVSVAEPVVVGALLPVTVYLPSTRDYTVMAEAMWCRPEGDRFLVGFQVFDSDDESVAVWKEAVAELFEGQ